MLFIFMAYNVISCKKIKRNTKEIKIADLTVQIRLPTSEMTKNRQKTDHSIAIYSFFMGMAYFGCYW